MKIASKIKQALHITDQSENKKAKSLDKGSFKNHKVTGSAENTHMPSSSDITISGDDSRIPLNMQNIAVAVQKPAGPPAAPPPPPVKIQTDTWAQIKQNIHANQNEVEKKGKKIVDSDHMKALFDRLKKRRKETERTETVLVTEPRELESQPVEPARVAPVKIEAVYVAPGMIPPPPPLPAVLSGKKVKNNDGKPASESKQGLKRPESSTAPRFRMTLDMINNIRLKRTERSF